MKKRIKIRGTVDLGSLQVGERAKLILENGSIVLTSRIVTPPFVGGGVIQVETAHSIYCNY